MGGAVFEHRFEDESPSLYAEERLGEAMPSRSARPGGPEGRYLAGPGRPLNRHVAELKEQMHNARASDKQSKKAIEQAERERDERRLHHRGGGLPWPVRVAIPVGIVAEAATAFVAMEVLVSSLMLAIGLAMLTALVGAGMAFVLANRRLNRLPVPGMARVLEGVFVAVLMLLRYDSLRLQGADLVGAVGGAALAALISSMGLLGIEEVIVESRTFNIFLRELEAGRRRFQRARAASRLVKIQARLDAVAEKLRQDFLDFLLKAEGLTLDEAQKRAEALKSALLNTGGKLQ